MRVSLPITCLLRLGRVPSLELRPEPASPGEARSFIRKLMAEWGVEAAIADDAELLVTEVVTNAVIHARSSLWLEVEADQGFIEFSVFDQSPGNVQLRIPSPDSATGRGILLLDKLSSDWEVVPERGGKTVRFRLSATLPSSVSHD